MYFVIQVGRHDAGRQYAPQHYIEPYRIAQYSLSLRSRLQETICPTLFQGGASILLGHEVRASIIRWMHAWLYLRIIAMLYRITMIFWLSITSHHYIFLFYALSMSVMYLDGDKWCFNV